MTARKLSISVPAEVEETIRSAAAGEGKPVSAWLAEAATEKARAAALHAAGRAAARELIAEYEQEHGPLPAESRRRARQFLTETGLLDNEPQPQISRVLKGCDIIPDDERPGRAAGVACPAAGTTDVAGAIVIATAVRHQAPIVTSDPGDLARIADAISVKIRLCPT